MKRKLEIIDNILSTDNNTVIRSIENKKRSYSYDEKITFVNNVEIININYHTELHKALEENYKSKQSCILGLDEESSRKELISLGKYNLHIRNKSQSSDKNDRYLVCSNKECSFHCYIVKCGEGWCLYRVSQDQHKSDCHRIEYIKDSKFMSLMNTPRKMNLNDRIESATNGIIANLNLHPEFAVELNKDLAYSDNISIGNDLESSKLNLEKIAKTKLKIVNKNRDAVTLKCNNKLPNKLMIDCPWSSTIVSENEIYYLSSLSKKHHSNQCNEFRSIIYNNRSFDKIIFHKIDRTINENDKEWFFIEFVQSFNENYQKNRIEIFKSNQIYVLSSNEIPEWLDMNGRNQFQDYIYNNKSYKGGFIITRGNEKLGAFLYSLQNDTLYIAEFFISSKYKRQGIGSKVLTKEMLSVVGNFEHMDILCRTVNPSVNFYNKTSWLKENHDIVHSYDYSDSLYRGFSTKSSNHVNLNDLSYYHSTHKESEDSTYTDREIIYDIDINNDDINIIESNNYMPLISICDSPKSWDGFNDILGDPT